MLEFDDFFGKESLPERLAEGAWVLREYAKAEADALLSIIKEVAAIAPFRAMTTKGGFKMTVKSTGCGNISWVSIYSDPSAGPVPTPSIPLPPLFRDFAKRAALAAGFPDFEPDACLINLYEPGASMGLHQDKDEKNLREPIVSVSLGLPIVFLFGGKERGDKAIKVPLDHGDVVVWGGPARLAFHGVLKLQEGWHPKTGRQRINLTFRKMG